MESLDWDYLWFIQSFVDLFARAIRLSHCYCVRHNESSLRVFGLRLVLNSNSLIIAKWLLSLARIRNNKLFRVQHRFEFNNSFQRNFQNLNHKVSTSSCCWPHTKYTKLQYDGAYNMFCHKSGPFNQCHYDALGQSFVSPQIRNNFEQFCVFSVCNDRSRCLWHVRTRANWWRWYFANVSCILSASEWYCAI